MSSHGGVRPPDAARRLAGAVLCAALAACGQPLPDSGGGAADMLRGDHEAGYAKARAGEPLRFPADHGAHPAFKNEWWYFTGNLRTPGRRHFGFQFTLFRSAVSPKPPASDSHWATNQVYLAHLAVTDTESGRLLSDERFARGALGLAGVSPDPFRAWLEDWQVSATATCGECLEVILSAKSERFGLTLTLRNSKPPVLHGNAGLSLKSESGDNASHYYSYPRLRVEGLISTGDDAHHVGGDAWFDHEWSTSSLEADQVGWDWFSIQLNDDTELMLFQLRHADAKDKHFLYGTYIDEQGRSSSLPPDGFDLTPTATWRSPVSGATYPVAWRIRVPSRHLSLALRAVTEAQELDRSFRYWEGAVQVRGNRQGREIGGHGYLELTGYR